jgi:magnesium transporter
MISTHLYRGGRPVKESVPLAQAADELGVEGCFLWVDVVDPTDDDLSALQDAFGLHPLTVEDARHRHQRPRVELFGGYAFIAVRPLSADDAGEIVEQEVHAFAGPRFLATLRYAPAFELDEVVRRWERQPELLASSGGGFAAYAMLDEVVDDYLTLVERFEDRADQLEDDVFSEGEIDGGSGLQARIFRLKRDVVGLRRYAMPLRQGIDLLIEEPRFADSPMLPYYRDVMEHALRVVELADNVRDLLTSLLEVRISQLANHTNDIMKKLTSWAAIILIPTLIAGIYGMNFQHMPELGWKVGYPVALGTMVVASTALYVVFKKRGWL